MKNIGITPVFAFSKYHHLNLDENGDIFCVEDAVVDHYGCGLPFDQNGRLCVTFNPVIRIDQGVPFAANGNVCFGAGPATRFDQGIAINTNGQLVSANVPPTRKILLFAEDTTISFANGPWDASKVQRIEYKVRCDDLVTNRDIWGTDDGNNYGRFRSLLDFRVFRGGSGGNLGSLDIDTGTIYDVEEKVDPAGTATVTINTIGAQSALVGASGISAGWRIGGRVGGFGWIGSIVDFKIYDATDTLVHFWPIDDNVADGGTIVDVVGGLNGTLTLGSGQWIN